MRDREGSFPPLGEMPVSSELREAHEACHAHAVRDDRAMAALEQRVDKMLAEKDALERHIAALERGS